MSKNLENDFEESAGVGQRIRVVKKTKTIRELELKDSLEDGGLVKTRGDGKKASLLGRTSNEGGDGHKRRRKVAT